MSKKHYLDPRKTMNFGTGEYQYKTACGLTIGYTYNKLADDEVFMGVSVDHARDPEKVDCLNCRDTINFKIDK